MIHFGPRLLSPNDYQPFVGVDNFLSTSELENLSQYLNTLNTSDSEINVFGENKIIPEYRKTKTAFFYMDDSNEFFCSKFGNQLSVMNSASYKFDLFGIVDPFQYTVYDGGDKSHYDWHVDIMNDQSKPFRKLSAVLQLSEPDEYDGGELEINYFGNQDKPVVVPKKKNLLVVFPSFFPHRVTPVTKGNRKTIVAWCCGNTFK